MSLGLDIEQSLYKNLYKFISLISGRREYVFYSLGMSSDDNSAAQKQKEKMKVMFRSMIQLFYLAQKVMMILQNEHMKRKCRVSLKGGMIKQCFTLPLSFS